MKKNKMTNILIADSGAGFGGTSKYLGELLPELRSLGFSPFAVFYGDGPLARSILEKMPDSELHSEWRTAGAEDSSGRPFARARHLMKTLFQMMILSPAIVRWLSKHRVGLVHLNNEVLSHLPLILAAKFAGCRILCHLHGWRPMTMTERLVLPWVDEFMSISEAGARYFCGGIRRPVLAVPNGVAEPQLDSGQVQAVRAKTRLAWGWDEATVGCVIAGRLTAWKGQEVFIRALASALNDNPRLKGAIVGEDPSSDKSESKRLRALSEELGIGGSVSFIPWMEDISGAYAAADIVIHASVRPEPFGLVILEAMQFGRAVIASRAGGVLDIVRDEVTGILTEPGGTLSLKKAMVRLADDPALRSRLGAQGQQRAKTEFSLKRNAEMIGAIYRRLLALP